MKDEFWFNHPADELGEPVRQATAAILKKYDRAYYRTEVRAGRQPEALWSALGDAGLLGLGVPESAGGSGGGLVEQTALIEMLAIAGIPGTPLVLASFTRNLMLQFGSSAQIEAFVPPTLVGNARYSFAITEADAGTNSFAMRTRAQLDGDEWVINGEKSFISHIEHASKLLLVARTSKYDPERKTQGLSIFAIDLPAEGITTSRMNIDIGDAASQYIVSFEDVRLPKSALVGAEGEGSRYLFHALNPERIFTGAISMGLGVYLLERAAEYASVRAPFGRPIGAYQAVQHPLAKALIELRAGRSLLYEAALAIDSEGNGTASGVVANAAKYLLTEAAGGAHDAAVRAFGGYGFDDDYDIVSFYKRLRLFRIAPINNESVLSFTAERVLGLPSSK